MCRFKIASRGIVAVMVLILVMISPISLLARERSYNFNAKTPANSAIRSLILPGWGQFFNDQPTKGFIFVGAELVAAGTAFMMYSSASSTYDDYETKRTDDLYNDYSSQVDTANIFVYVAAAVWVGNIVDAYLSASSAGAALPQRGLYLTAKGNKQIGLVYRYTF